MITVNRHKPSFLEHVLQTPQSTGVPQTSLPQPGQPRRAPYLFGDQQAVRVLDGRALVQQQGLKLPLLDVIESVEHHSEKLQR